MQTNTRIIKRIAQMSAIGLCTALPAGAATTFFSYGGTGYTSGTLKPLEGDQSPNHVIGSSDQYGDPDGWSGPGAYNPPTVVPSGLVGRAFSSSTAFSPGVGVYSGPEFFGGASVTSTLAGLNEGFHELGISNAGGGDAIHWTVDSNTGITHSAHVFAYFKKDQFAAPWNTTSPITDAYMSDASFDVHTGQLLQAGPNDTRMYWMVQDGSQFWLAQNYHLITQNAAFSTNFAAITGWALYDPSSNLAALDFNEGSAFAAHAFSDIQGFGFYVEHEDGSTSSHGEIDGFVVNVPEPSRAMLLLGGLIPILLRRRR